MLCREAEDSYDRVATSLAQFSKEGVDAHAHSSYEVSKDMAVWAGIKQAQASFVCNEPSTWNRAEFLSLKARYDAVARSMELIKNFVTLNHLG